VDAALAAAVQPCGAVAGGETSKVFIAICKNPRNSFMHPSTCLAGHWVLHFGNTYDLVLFDKMQVHLGDPAGPRSIDLQEATVHAQA
jgi:hypothetical protein